MSNKQHKINDSLFAVYLPVFINIIVTFFLFLSASVFAKEITDSPVSLKKKHETGSSSLIGEIDSLAKELIMNEENNTKKIAQGVRIFSRARRAENKGFEQAYNELITLKPSLNCQHHSVAFKLEKYHHNELLSEKNASDFKSYFCSQAQELGGIKKSYQKYYELLNDLFDKGQENKFLDSISADDGILDKQYSLVPNGFTKPFSIVSDADSQNSATANQQLSFLNSNLGLPLTSSAYIVSSSDNVSADVGKNPTAFFFPANTEKEVFGSRDSFLNTLQQWHAGYFDHYHGWSDTRVQAEHRYVKPELLKEIEGINLTKLFSKADNSESSGIAPQWRSGSYFLERWVKNQFSVLRLYLTKQPNRELQLQLHFPNRKVAYDINAQQAFSKQVQEDGKTLWMIELPITSDSDVKYVRETRLDKSDSNNIVLKLSHSKCLGGEANVLGCDAKLVKVEADLLGRWAMERNVQWLKEFGVSGSLYTAHGGDRLSSFGPDNYVQSEWNKSNAKDGITDVNIGEPIAAFVNSKSYIGDLVSDLGVRGVRPFQSNRLLSGVMTLFPDPPATVREFGNTVSISTNWALTPTPIKDFDASLNLRKETKEKLDLFASCNFSASDWIIGYIEASMRSTSTPYPAGEVWYTHFAPRCVFKKGNEQYLTGFSKVLSDYFQLLARSSYGLINNAEKAEYPNRLWVVPATVAFRSRILHEEVNNYGLDISNNNGKVVIKSRDSQYYDDQLFPRKGLETRDLNGLTLKVDRETVKQATLLVDDKPLYSIVKNIQADHAYLTILDTTQATPLIDDLPWNKIKKGENDSATFTSKYIDKESQKSINFNSKKSGQYSSCWSPNESVDLKNISSLGFTLGNVKLSEKLIFGIEIALKDKKEKVVFSNDEALLSKKNNNLDTIYNFSAEQAVQLSQPDKQRFLLPTYDVSGLDENTYKSSKKLPTFLSGSIEQLCFTIRSSNAFSFNVSKIRAYKYVTNSSKIDDPLIVGGHVDSKLANELSGKPDYSHLVVKATLPNGVTSYGAINDDGFFYLSFLEKERMSLSKIGSSTHVQEVVDQILKDQVVKLDLINSDANSESENVVNSRAIQFLHSRVDLKLTSDEGSY